MRNAFQRATSRVRSAVGRVSRMARNSSRSRSSGS